MKAAPLRLDVSAGIARLTLTSGDRGNPIDADLCSALCERAIVLSEMPGLRAVLLTAEGRNFSFGGDINSLTGDFATLPANIKRWTTTLHSAIARLQRMDAPLIAAVQGVCAGGMSGFVAGCDVVVAGQDARFVAAYASIGFCCDASSSITYSRRMGLGRARRFLIMNETLGAEAALHAGLIDEVCEPASLTQRAEAVATTLAAGPTRAFGEIRRLLLSAADQPLETQLELEAQALARVAGTADAREGLTAFLEKRKAVFTGM